MEDLRDVLTDEEAKRIKSLKSDLGKAIDESKQYELWEPERDKAMKKVTQLTFQINGIKEKARSRLSSSVA